jgi:hypothetical protein
MRGVNKACWHLVVSVAVCLRAIRHRVMTEAANGRILLGLVAGFARHELAELHQFAGDLLRLLRGALTDPRS